MDAAPDAGARSEPREPRASGPALLEALAGGDRAALAEVTQVITGYLVRHGGLELRDQWDDLVQDVIVALLKAWRRGSVRDERAFIHYTGMTARNRLFDLFRRRRSAGIADPVGEPEEAAAARDDTPETRPIDLLVDLERALESLPAVERSVVEAIYVQGHSYQEAAERVRMPLGSLKRYQSSGLRQLRSHMGISSPRSPAHPSPGVSK